MKIGILDILTKKDNSGKKSAESISRMFLLSITLFIALVFLLFYFVGYDTPAMWDERYNNPLLTDVLLMLMILLFVTSCGVVLFSKIHSLRNNHDEEIENGIHGKRITYSVVGAVLLLMALAYLALPASEMIVNGEVFNDMVWLRTANMFVVSCLVMIVAGIVAIVYGAVMNRRR